MLDAIAETVVAAGGVPLAVLEQAPELKWFQAWSAGVDRLVESSVLRDRNVTITNASGIHAEPVSEHVFALLLALARSLPESFRRRGTREWPPQSVHRPWELAGKHMLIAGVGTIGRRMAEIARAHRMTVTGIRRHVTSEDDDSIRGVDELPDLVAGADIIVNVLPLTKETRGLFSRSLIDRFKSGAVFVNVGRGASVDQSALIAALEEGRISAAGLDVTDPEPLPADSPLWTMDNVIITPHMAGITPEYSRRAWKLFFENLERFHAGKPLINRVDPEAGY